MHTDIHTYIQIYVRTYMHALLIIFPHFVWSFLKVKSMYKICAFNNKNNNHFEVNDIVTLTINITTLTITFS